MACRNRELAGEESAVPAAATLSDALLFATMCIVGFPVDAHLIDGSIFSGTFFTASVEEDSGIVLKNAKMIKKGKSAANVGIGSVIETLVVRFVDLLQVVVKGTALPKNGIACNIAGDPFKIVVDINEGSSQNEEAANALGDERQAKGGKTPEESVHCGKKSEIQKIENKEEVQASLLAAVSCIPRAKSVGEICSDSSSKLLPNREASGPPSPSDKLNNQCQNDCASENSFGSNSVSAAIHHTSVELEHPKQSSPTPKGSKLNPEAKLFRPSVTNQRSITPPALPTVANVGYVPDNYTVVPIASPQPDVEINSFVSQSYMPAKFLPYADSVGRNGISDSQYSQPFIGHMGARTQAVRYGGQQIHPIHAGATYVTSNPQNVMVGRGGQPQMIYMPVSHDVNQTAAALSQVSLQPSLTPHFGHLSKHQGNMAAQPLQMYVNPTFMTSGQQQVPVQSHSSLNPPPFPIAYQFPVQGATTGFFTPKLP